MAKWIVVDNNISSLIYGLDELFSLRIDLIRIVVI